ncbi:polysaccharide pyruvyl transferase family protein [Gordonia ajococcus]|uniref:polysaccharide pyruvyl transferase family protein n=1 Tax=Gordonia ajococcus TaxID=1292359 RepID=UPI00177D56EB|nr:polysaccharide pyruvyl transferase family protein [Gordonia ajococcus]
MIGWLDPSIGSENTGDQIIADAVRTELTDAGLAFQRFSTRRKWTREECDAAAQCSMFIVGGTNLINGNYPWYRQWKFDANAFRLLRRKTVGLGIGWWQYQPRTNRLSRFLWREILGHGVNSCRDEYTSLKLDELRIRALNTSCVTMWRLPEVLNQKARSSRVVVTLTDYNRHFESDYALLRYAIENYHEVYLWPQGVKDEEYCRRMKFDSLQFGDVSLAWFDEALDSGEFDYIGTRLHAGIRAHQKRANSLIVAVDNRALEISRDTGLPVVTRDEVIADSGVLEVPHDVNLTLPADAISEWKDQFLSTVLR